MKTDYVAFLRGINVGGNKVVKMSNLKNVFESLGLRKVKTLLASGNVVFETIETDEGTLQHTIEEELEKRFGFPISVMLRTKDEIETLLASQPFAKVNVTQRTRLLVTFLVVKHMSKIKTPYKDQHFSIVHLYPREVCSVTELSPQGGTPEVMQLIEKEFGKKVTTRTWNTVTKIAKLFNSPEE